MHGVQSAQTDEFITPLNITVRNKDSGQDARSFMRTYMKNMSAKLKALACLLETVT